MTPKDYMRLAEVNTPITVGSKRSTEVGPHHTVLQADEGF